ncbi:helix-turn-helix domain-containing protein [Haloprofundus salilacus]|uniref:helix-turn-helix domain-containing protein n=1 Tax=Haloprofundus salilacus TaxID=2876190 RepID=UPI001CCA54A0|nr:helix-turn-helix domain-containing protein [Haloprofundus salilacus]
MSHIAEFELSSPKIPLLSALEAAPSMELRVEEAVPLREPTPLFLFLWASGGDFDAFESALEDDETVTAVDVLDRFEHQQLYRICVDGDEVFYPVGATVGASRLEVTATYDGLHVRMRFPDRKSLSAFRKSVRERGATFSLKRLYTPDSPGVSEQYGLSEKQRSALRTAVDIGYYDVPRRASLDELADELGISGQATSERLRRGTVTLVRNTIGVEP